jgi:hypothetical protein
MPKPYRCHLAASRCRRGVAVKLCGASVLPRRSRADAIAQLGDAVVGSRELWRGVEAGSKLGATTLKLSVVVSQPDAVVTSRSGVVTESRRVGGLVRGEEMPSWMV